MRAYYDAVVGSLVRALLRRDVLAVYARGSLVRGDLDLGRSDVDLVVVAEDEAPQGLPAR
ncbi:MAG: nucleotidyltransferase domain-containing protein [Thermoleophilia bacterium]